MLRWLLPLLCAPLLFAQSDATQIQKMMNDSAEVWNRGDLNGFMAYYEDSPQTVYMGRELVRGKKAILERYRKSYPTREAMGTVTFSEMEVRPLAGGFALLTGKFELKRTAAGGGPAWGRYTLIVHQTK